MAEPERVERVARAMCAAFGCEWEGEGLLRPEDYRCLAAAAIEATGVELRLTEAGRRFFDAQKKALAIYRRAKIENRPDLIEDALAEEARSTEASVSP